MANHGERKTPSSTDGGVEEGSGCRVYWSVQAAVIDYHRLGGLNNNSFISELCKSKIEVPSELVSDEASLILQEVTFLLCLHMAFALYPDRVLVSPSLL